MIVLGKGTAKPTERSFKGKGVGDFRGIVRFWKVMRSDGRCGNPSGSRPNFLGRQHLTFDKGGKFSAKQRIVRFWKGWRCISQCSYNNNSFFDRLNRRAKHGGS